MKNQPCKENNNLLNLEKKIFFSNMMKCFLSRLKLLLVSCPRTLSRLPCLLVSCLVSYQDYHVY